MKNGNPFGFVDGVAAASVVGDCGAEAGDVVFFCFVVGVEGAEEEGDFAVGEGGGGGGGLSWVGGGR